MALTYGIRLMLCDMTYNMFLGYFFRSGTESDLHFALQNFPTHFFGYYMTKLGKSSFEEIQSLKDGPPRPNYFIVFNVTRLRQIRAK